MLRLQLNQELTDKIVSYCESIGNKNYLIVFNEIVNIGLDCLTRKSETKTIIQEQIVENEKKVIFEKEKKINKKEPVKQKTAIKRSDIKRGTNKKLKI